MVCTSVCSVTVRVKVPSASARNSVKRPSAPRVARRAARVRRPLWHCAEPEHRVRREAGAVDLDLLAVGVRAGGVSMLSTGGGATAVGSKPSGTSVHHERIVDRLHADDARADRVGAVRDAVGDDDARRRASVSSRCTRSDGVDLTVGVRDEGVEGHAVVHEYG